MSMPLINGSKLTHDISCVWLICSRWEKANIPHDNTTTSLQQSLLHAEEYNNHVADDTLLNEHRQMMTHHRKLFNGVGLSFDSHWFTHSFCCWPLLRGLVANRMQLKHQYQQ
jgi:hypothetical protein